MENVSKGRPYAGTWWTSLCQKGGGFLPVKHVFNKRSDVASYFLKRTCVQASLRAAYMAFRADHKARQQAHRFERWSNCMRICEQCMAQRMTPKWDASMNYMDFNDNAARYMTRVSHETYLRTAERFTPWTVMPGFHLQTVLHDLQHTLYLGLCRDLVASLMSDFLEHGVLGAGSLECKLERFSHEMNKEFKARKKPGITVFSQLRLLFHLERFLRISVRRLLLTPANLNLVSKRKGEYPVLGNIFKAAHVKAITWYTTMKAIEFAEETQVP